MQKNATLETKGSINRWLGSLAELRSLRNVVFCGLMAAIAVALGYVTSIQLGPYIKVGFSGYPNQVVACFFGPAVGAIFGAALDVLKWFVKPTGAFFPGFTISAALGGIIYGFAFYKKKITVVRVFVAHLIVTIFVNIILNTLWLTMFYDQAVMAILPMRVIKNACMLPVDTFLTYTILKAMERTVKPMLQDN